ncbi:unnamed protein product [Closterium sp. Yama58-4]|nr:unnamed protein product [Closterium sp. Yama58-4]
MGVAKGTVATVSANVCDFILAAVRDELRVDGRKPFDYRSWDRRTGNSRAPSLVRPLYPHASATGDGGAAAAQAPHSPHPHAPHRLPSPPLPASLLPTPPPCFPLPLPTSSASPLHPTPPHSPICPPHHFPHCLPTPPIVRLTSPPTASPLPPLDDGTTEVQLGSTRVLASLSAASRCPSPHVSLSCFAPSPIHPPSPLPETTVRAEVQLGSTLVLASVTAALTLPFPDRPFGQAPFRAYVPHRPSTRDDGTSEVQLGGTWVQASVSAALTLPFPDRPNEGSLAVFTELAPMADPRFVPGRPGEEAIELGRIIDRGLCQNPSH